MTAEQQLLKDGYSPTAVAMMTGGPVGSPEYYAVLKKIDPKRTGNCPHCGEMCFGTGDCNCMEE